MRATIVAGRVVFENGRITGVDEKALRAELRALMGDYARISRAPAQEAQRLEPHYRAMYLRAARRGYRHEPLARVVFAPDQFGF